MDINELLHGFDDGEAAKKAACAMEHVIIESGALTSLNSICANYHGILMVSDHNTYRVCGKDVADILGNKIVSAMRFETGDAPLIPDEAAIAAIQDRCVEGVELILGVGSGVINDLCKIVSFERKLPY